jgi:hypothetical protein
MFDTQALLHLLREAGFEQVEASSFGRSAVPEIGLIDSKYGDAKAFTLRPSNNGVYSIGSTTTESAEPRTGICTITIADKTSTIPRV